MKIGDNIKIFLAFLFFTGLIAGTYLLMVKYGGIEFENKQTTVGEVVEIKKVKSGSMMDVVFCVEGERYKAGTDQGWGEGLGFKYVVAYEKGNPEKNDVLKYRPVFTADEKTKYSVGTVISISRNPSIGFRYKVGNDEYKMYQMLKRGYREDYPNLQKGQQYKVEYWVKNPQRAVISLDKPVNEKKKNSNQP